MTCCAQTNRKHGSDKDILVFCLVDLSVQNGFPSINASHLHLSS